MSVLDTVVDRAASLVERRTTRRGFLGRTAIVGSALTVAAPTYVLRPGTAYAAVTRTRCADCRSGLCCDGYTEFCCHLDSEGQNECPPGTLLAGWWKVDNSDYCFGTARYYMDCNTASPGCRCGGAGSCQDDVSRCGCRDCQSRKDGCTVFRYGNCNNHVSCVGPIMCRLVTCTKPWEIEPTCSQVARTDNNTRFHHRPCLERDPDEIELSFVRALYVDFLGRSSDATGEAYWGNRLVRGSHLAGGVRDIIAESFAFSDEYVSFVVDGLYREAFGRPSDPEGKAFWTGRLQKDLTPQDLAVIFFASDEFHDASGNDDATWVRRLYRAVLDREASDAEVEGWTQVLTDGGDRTDVAREVYASEESRRIRVASLYRRFLNRGPEPDGRDYWVEVLRTREDLSLALFLAASNEYLDRAVARFTEPEPEPDPEPPPPDDPVPVP